MANGQDKQAVGYSQKGFLTTADKRLLLSDEDGDPKQRQRLRNRTRHAIEDFSLLFEHLDERDRKQIFEEYSDEDFHSTAYRLGEKTDDLGPQLADLIAFIFLGLADHDWVRPIRKSGHHVGSFDSLLYQALEKAYSELGVIFEDSNLEIISYREDDIEELKKKLSVKLQRSEPSGEGVRILIDAGEINSEALREFLLDELEDED